MSTKRKETEYTTEKNRLKKFTYSGGLIKSIDIANFYNFNTIPPIPISTAAQKETRKILNITRLPNIDPKVPDLAILNRVNLLSHYKKNLWRKLPHPINIVTTTKQPGKISIIDLATIGDNNSISDSVALHTIINMLQEDGEKNIYLEINSVGDKDSRQAFFRDFTAYYRQHINNLPTECREAFKMGPEHVGQCNHDFCNEIAMSAPQSLNYLTDSSKKAFKNILEYLDEYKVPYRVNNNLIGNRRIFSDLIFEIRKLPKDGDMKNRYQNELLATGARSNFLYKRLNINREIPLFYSQIKIKKSAKKESFKQVEDIDQNATASVFFAQISKDAKLQGLRLASTLRKSGLDIAHYIGKDKLSDQMAKAARLKTPYVVIIGQLESIDKTVIVRKMSDRSQVIIPQDKLASYLKTAINKLEKEKTKKTTK